MYIYVYMYVYIYVCIYIYMYTYIYEYIYIYIRITNIFWQLNLCCSCFAFNDEEGASDTLFPRVYVYIATRGLQQGLEFSQVRQLGSVRDHGELSVCIYHVGIVRDNKQAREKEDLAQENGGLQRPGKIGCIKSWWAHASKAVHLRTVKGCARNVSLPFWSGSAKNRWPGSNSHNFIKLSETRNLAQRAAVVVFSWRTDTLNGEIEPWAEHYVGHS